VLDEFAEAWRGALVAPFAAPERSRPHC